MKQAEIQQLLPEIFQRVVHPGNPLYAVLAAMELLQAPSEEVLQHLETFFDPRRTPAAFVPYLASWVDLDRLLSASATRPDLAVQPAFPTGIGRLRELVAAAPYLSRWRGTTRGLLTFLEIATGLKGFMIEEQPAGPDGLPRPFHLRIQAPAMDATYRTLVENIIELEKPAYVTFEISYAAIEDKPAVEDPAPAPGPSGPSSQGHPPALSPAPGTGGPVTVSTGTAGPLPAAGSPPVPPVGFQPPVFRPRLEVALTGLVIPIPPGPVLIGRNDPASGTRPEIDVNNIDTTKSVSRRHARITFEQGNFFLTEQINEANGTFINGQRLAPQVPTLLHDGDHVKLGQFELVFRVT